MRSTDLLVLCTVLCGCLAVAADAIPSMRVPAPPLPATGPANYSFGASLTFNTTVYYAWLENPRGHWSVHCPNCASPADTCNGTRVKTDDQAVKHRCKVATNGGPFGMKSPDCIGPVVSNGVVAHRVLSVNDFACFGMLKSGDIFLGKINSTSELDGFEQLLCGFGWLVYDKEIIGKDSKHPFKAARTMLGVDANGRLLSTVVQGSQNKDTVISAGVTMRESAQIAADLGAVYAIALDGGGSSAMFVEDNGGIQGCPTCIDDFICCVRSVVTTTCFNDA